MSTIMQKSGLTSNQSATTPFFSAASWGGSSGDKDEGRKHRKSESNTSAGRSRPGTSSGLHDPLAPLPPLPVDAAQGKAPKEGRKLGFSRKASFTYSVRGLRRSSNGGIQPPEETIKTDASKPPAIPDFAFSKGHAPIKLEPDTEPPITAATTTTTAIADSSPVSQSLNKLAPPPPKSTPTPPTPSAATANMTSYYPFKDVTSPPMTGGPTAPPMQLPPLEGSSSMVHTHICEMSNKRISTLEYLRKSHEGRLFWFNTLMFDKPDLARMPYYDNRKLARRSTNYLLLGLSLPIVIDLSSSTAVEFLRSLNTLLSEFESYQQIHTENGVNSSTFSRGRIPSMFRRGPGGKGRRQSAAGDMGYIADGGSSGHGGAASSYSANGAAVNAPTSVINFGLGGEGNDLLPGEEYTHLLTPNLPFEPDFFETFATLCDVLIDCYNKLMSLVPNPKDCTPAVAELFAKADSRVRKIIVQGVVKEFETTSRAMLKQEVENVGKVVLGGLM